MKTLLTIVTTIAAAGLMYAIVTQSIKITTDVIFDKCYDNNGATFVHKETGRKIYCEPRAE